MKKNRCVLISILVFLCVFGSVYADDSVGEQLTLQEGITRIIRNNRGVIIASIDSDIASQSVVVARSVLLPQINVSASQSFLSYQPGAKFGTLSVYTSERRYFSYGVDVYQTLFDFGKNLSVYNAAKSDVDAVKWNAEYVKNQTVLEFILTYFDLLDAEKMISVVQKEIDSLTAYLHDIENLYEQGAAIRSDLLSAKVKRADAQQRLITVRNQRGILAARINNLLAFPLDKKISARDLRVGIPVTLTKSSAWDIACKQRPELKIIEARLMGSFYRERAKAKENLPVLFAEGAYNYMDNQYQLRDDNASLQVGVKFPLFDGWRAKGEVVKERAIQSQLFEEQKKIEEDIRFELERDYRDLQDAGEKTTVARDAVSEAAEVVRINKVKYSEGAANATEVLEAIAMQAGAETNYTNADYELKRAYARLMYAMGIDLSLVYESMEGGGNGTKK